MNITLREHIAIEIFRLGVKWVIVEVLAPMLSSATGPFRMNEW